MNNINNQNLKAVLFAVTAFLCFTIADAVVKNIMTLYEPSFIASITYGLETLYIVIFALLTGNFSKLYRSSHLGMQIIRGLGGGAAYLFFMAAIGKFNVPLTTGYAIVLSSPFWIALASLFVFKDKIGSHRWLAIFLGFIGVLIILQPGTNQFSFNHIYPLLAALCFMVMAIASRIIGDKSIYELTFYILFIPAIMLSLIHI